MRRAEVTLFASAWERLRAENRRRNVRIKAFSASSSTATRCYRSFHRRRKPFSFLGMSAITRSRESAECRLLLCLFIESKACDSSPVARVQLRLTAVTY